MSDTLSFTLLGSRFSVRVLVRFGVHGSGSRFGARREPRNTEPQTPNTEPNVNTNREGRR
jgi:hypothetical protein